MENGEMALAECPCLPPLLSLLLFLGPVVGSAGFSWAWGSGPFWGGGLVLRGAGMACPGAASVIAVWLSGALAQQVASRIPSLPEPRHAIGHLPRHLELRNPVFWKSEGWKEELGLWGGSGQDGLEGKACDEA